MKRSLALLALWPALAAALLLLTRSSAPATRAVIAQGLAMVSVTALILLAGVYRRAERTTALASDVRGAEVRRPPACGFGDVAANTQALQSLSELRDYLKQPEKYARYGARMPKGVLLYGPPGTGKTLLARALAGEAGVPFFALSGSDFVEKYVGVGASRVRALFKKARKAGRCVVFIDEIDAVGRRRDDVASDERDQTLNALLSEMSGFQTGDGVIVMAATNRVEALDPALLRPGRFDRQIEVGLPGRAERLSILRLHSRGKPMDDDVSLETLAAQTVGFSGASLENLVNEAALSAAGRGDGPIRAQDLQRAFTRAVAGDDRQSSATDRERHIIAIHEAGHALASRVLTPESRLTRVSILPAGHGAAGYNLCVPAERVMLEKRHLEGQIQVLLAGRAAEQMIFGEDGLTAGASTDLARAAELAAAMVTDMGMTGDPSLSITALQRRFGADPGAAEACKALLRNQYSRVQALLRAEEATLTALAAALMEAETLEGESVVEIIEVNLSSDRLKSA